MPTETRRIRDRIYQKKRRLYRQVLAGKITPDQMELILTADASRQINSNAVLIPSEVKPTESENIPRYIRAAIQECIKYDRDVDSGEPAKEGAWLTSSRE